MGLQPGGEPVGGFDEFYRARYRATVGLARRLGVGDAEDVAQTAFVRLLGRFDGLVSRGEDPFPYLYRIVVNLARNEARATRRLARLLRLVAPVRPSSVPGPVPADPVIGPLRRLGVGDQTVLVLRCFEELPFDEIGRVLGCSEASARQRFRRAKARLAAELGRDPDGPDGPG